MPHALITPLLERLCGSFKERQIKHRFLPIKTTWLIAALSSFLLLLASCGVGPASLDRFREGVTLTVSASADLQIVEELTNSVTSVRAIPSEVTMARGGVAILAAAASDAQERLLQGVDYTWRVLTPLAGTVTSSGVFTAGTIPGAYVDAIEVAATHTVGNREFTATSAVSIVVTSDSFETSVASVVVLPASPTARVGDRVPLRAIAMGSAGGLVQDIALFWRVLDPTLGGIDDRGLLTVGDEPGFYEDAVEVQVRRLSGSAPPVSKRVSVTVLSSEAASDRIRAIIGPSFVVGQSGDRFPLVLLTFDSEGRRIESESVRWELSDPAVGSLSEDGVLVLGDTPKRFSQALVATAKLAGAYAGRSASAAIDVVVAAPGAQELRGVPGAAAIVPSVLRLRPGESGRFSVQRFDSNGIPVITADLNWSADPAVADVDSRGRVTALGEPGIYPAAIRIDVPSDDGSVTTIEGAVVILGPAVRVDVNPHSVSVVSSDLVRFTAIALDAAGSRLFDVRFEWSLAEGTPGSITKTGVYVSGDKTGDYPRGVVVVGTQRQPR